jgi:hypothetical protein
MTTPKALKRDEVYSLLMSIKKEGVILTTEQLDGMLLHFAPKVGPKVKTAMQWLSKAVAGNKDVRSALRLIYCDGLYAYASDGHRAHRIDADGLEAGFYCPKTFLPVEAPSMVYPKVAQVFEKPTKQLIEQVDLSSFSTTQVIKQVVYIIPVKEKSSVLKKYLDEAVNMETDIKVEVSGFYIYGESEFGSFVVMGLRT